MSHTHTPPVSAWHAAGYQAALAEIRAALARGGEDAVSEWLDTHIVESGPLVLDEIVERLAVNRRAAAPNYESEHAAAMLALTELGRMHTG